MSKFKDFGGGATAADAEPIVFKLHGEDFSCRPEIPGKLMLDLVANSSDDENPAAAALVVPRFFSAVLLPESLERFDALCDDPDRVVTMQTLTDIVEWLVETYSERPTRGPES
jgi:hypothetical protein